MNEAGIFPVDVSPLPARVEAKGERKADEKSEGEQERKKRRLSRKSEKEKAEDGGGGRSLAVCLSRLSPSSFGGRPKAQLALVHSARWPWGSPHLFCAQSQSRPLTWGARARSRPRSLEKSVGDIPSHGGDPQKSSSLVSE